MDRENLDEIRNESRLLTSGALNQGLSELRISSALNPLIIDDSGERAVRMSSFANTQGNTVGMQVLSQVEEAIKASKIPINVQEREEITVNGVRGIFANRAEVQAFRGPVPIEQYQVNSDTANAELMTKRQPDCVVDTQRIKYKFLKPPAPEKPGDLIIRQESDTAAPAAPPIVIRQIPAAPAAPAPIVIREEPPRAPMPIQRQIVTIPGKMVAPPARKLVIEKLPVLPTPPAQITVERWLGYDDRVRNVIFEEGQKLAPQPAPRNLVIQWETPCQEIKQEFSFEGVEVVNPEEYRSRFSGSMVTADRLPNFVSQFQAPPAGTRLAVNYNAEALPRLVGAVDKLRLIDLDRYGLSGYRSQLSGSTQYDAGSTGAQQQYGNNAANVLISSGSQPQYGNYGNTGGDVVTSQYGSNSSGGAQYSGDAGYLNVLDRMVQDSSRPGGY